MCVCVYVCVCVCVSVCLSVCLSSLVCMVGVIFVYIIIIIIIIIIAFKGTIRDFLQSPHSITNCLQHVRSTGAIVCKSRGTH